LLTGATVSVGRELVADILLVTGTVSAVWSLRSLGVTIQVGLV